MSKQRTQEQVDALWPEKKNEYQFAAKVTLRQIKTALEAAILIQRLYDGPQAIAGRFKVKEKKRLSKTEETTFDVVFFRDVHDDVEVVNDELLKGGSFNQVLREQLLQEIKNALADQRLDFPVKVARVPVFC